MIIDNVLTRMLGIKYPIIQGAFGWPQTGTSEIAVPVSEAGALGILTSICYKDPDAFQEDVRKAKSKTDKPFAVNFTLWKERGFDKEFHKEYIKIALDEGVKIVFTSAHDGSNIGKMFQETGGVWIHKCATIRHAVSIAEKGADAVVIVGIEGTGYKNPEQNSTLINITAGRNLVKAPLIAAGGIGDARGFIAALAMGASGIYMGTSFMTTSEFHVPDKLKNKIVNQDVLDNDYVQKVYKMKHDGLHSLASCVVHSSQTVKEYIEGIIKESQEIMSDFKKWGMVS